MTTDKSPEGAQDEALKLADALERDMCDYPCEAVALVLRRLHARVQELERERDSYKLLCDEWAEKTEWVQQTARPRELGLHRADALRERIKRAAAAEREVCAQMVAAYNTAMTDKIAAAIRARGVQGERNAA